MKIIMQVIHHPLWIGKSGCIEFMRTPFRVFPVLPIQYNVIKWNSTFAILFNNSNKFIIIIPIALLLTAFAPWVLPYLLIIGGTSLNVYPAAGLINYYRGSKLVLVNRSATPYDSYADLVIHANIGEVFSQI